MHSSLINKALSWFTISVVIAFLVPGLVQDGMFMDGELYAAVAHNEANGYGTFWFPKFSQVGMAGLTTFHEHPPLTFGMQAIWFKLLGSGFWVERSYAFCCALLTAWLMTLIWRELLPAERSERSLVWWPVLLWIIVPTVFWCYANNMMENTMGVFTAIAVLFAIKGGRTRWWIWHITAGLFVFLASMAKGIPGLFPVCVPLLLAIVPWHSNWRTGLAGSIIMTLVVVGSYGILMLWPEANASLTIYVESRLLHRVASVPTVVNRFATLEMLFTNMLAPLIIAALLALITWKTRGKNDLGRYALFMILVGLSGAAPLMLTMVQKSFYMAAALPFVAMAIALWSAPAVMLLMDRIGAHSAWVKGFRSSAVIVAFMALVAGFALFGKPGRDADVLRDVHAIGAQVPPHSLVSMPEELWEDWGLQTYFMRYHFISFDTVDSDRHWYITRKGKIPELSAHYRQVAMDTREFDLWKRVDL